MEKQCPVCKKELVFKEGESKKTGKPYAFWGCSGYPACTYIEKSFDKPAPMKTKDQGEEILNALRIMYDEIQIIKEMLKK